jgi:hypothetical protein
MRKQFAAWKVEQARKAAERAEAQAEAAETDSEQEEVLED